MNTKLILTVTFLVFGLCIMLIAANLQQKPWPVPDSYKNKKNLVKSTPESVKAGKVVYDKHCKSCHGSSGKGDGVKAKTLKNPSGDFTTPAFHKQTDGDLYYKSIIGRDEMPNFEKKIPDEEERWNVVNYIRTFKK